MRLDAVFFWSPQVTRFVRVWHTLTDASWHFTESVLQTFFCEALPPNLHCFHKLHPVTRGNLLYCQYKILCFFLGVKPYFCWLPLVKVWLENFSILSLARLWRRRHRLNACDLCKAHMKELQEFNQHWDQKAGFFNFKVVRVTWRMHHKDAKVYVESNVERQGGKDKRLGSLQTDLFDVQFLGMVFLIVSKY